MRRKLEKKLLFLPIINIFVYIYLIISIFSKKHKMKDVVLLILTTILCIIIITIPRIIIRNIFNNETLDLILFYISIWLYFISSNFCILCFEKKQNQVQI